MFLLFGSGSPRKNSYRESFKLKLGGGLLNAELFRTLYAAEALIQS